MKLTKTCSTPTVDATLYRQLVDILFYFNHSQPDISFFVSVVSWFMQDLWKSHLKVAKNIFHYIKGTYQLGIKYCSIMNWLVGYNDSNWVRCGDENKYTSIYVFHLGSRPIVWSCKKKNLASLSITK